MSATKTQAFVLRTQDYRDTSLLGRFYTRDYGKIHGIVRGIRDARGRFGSTLEPFSLNEILFYRRRRGGDLHQVTHVDLLNLFPEVREDLERLSYASYFIDLLDQMVEPEDPNPGIFDLLSDSLLFLTSGASPRRCARIFEVKLLGFLGLMPDIGDFVQAAPVRRVAPSRGTLNFLEHVKRSVEIKDLYRVKVSQEVGEELEKVLRQFVDFHLSHKLKSVVFLEKMDLTA